MGSFNTRCFLSQQTIKPGDAVKVLPIMQQSTYNAVTLRSHTDPTSKAFQMFGPSHSTCYSDAFWSIMCPILDGEYDDYGHFTLDDTPKNHTALLNLFHYLYDHALIAEQGENEYHEQAFHFQSQFNPKKKYSFKKLHELYSTLEEFISKNRVFVSTYRGVVAVNLTVASAIAFQELIDTAEQTPRWDGSRQDRNVYFDSQWEHDIAQWVQSHQQFEAKMLWGARFQRLFDLRTNAHNGISHYYAPDDSVMEHALTTYFQDHDLHALKKRFFDMGQEFFDMRYFLGGLEQFEIKVQPMTYAGQDYSNDIGRGYVAYVQAVEAKIRETLDLDEDEDDELDDDDDIVFTGAPV